MNSLIQITKNTINGAELNSANSREIYNYLEIKTEYSKWIQRAIEKYDFGIGCDFIIVKNGENTGRPTEDYIVTLDMAKELCMVSNSPKGKETRKYFIEAEKKQQRVLTTSEQIILLAQGHQEVEQRLTQIEHKIENEITLTSAQKFHLKQLVTAKVFELKNNHNLDDGFTKKNYQRIWGKLKKHFIVSSYMEIPKSKFDESCDIVRLVCLGDLL